MSNSNYTEIRDLATDSRRRTRTNRWPTRSPV